MSLPPLFLDEEIPVLPRGRYDLNTLTIGPGKALLEVRNPVRILGCFPQVRTRSVPLVDSKRPLGVMTGVQEITWLVLLCEPAASEPAPEDAT